MVTLLLFLGMGLLPFSVSTLNTTATFGMERYCSRTLTRVSEKRSQWHVSLGLNGTADFRDHCEISLETWHFNNIMFYIKHLNVSCDGGALDFYQGNSTRSSKISGLDSICGDIPPGGVFNTSSRFLRVRYTASQPSVQQTAMLLVATAFSIGPCSQYDYTCASGVCIAGDLVCSHGNPCGDFSHCPENNTTPCRNPFQCIQDLSHSSALSAGVILAIVGAGFAVTVVVLVMVVVHRCRNRNQVIV